MSRELTQTEKYNIMTIMNLVQDICQDHPDNACSLCPFWHWCEHSDETPYYLLETLFKNLLTND